MLERSDDPVEPPSVTLTLDLLGADHPGIVAEISAALAALDVNIEELSTDVRDAPWPAAPSSRRTPSCPLPRRPRRTTLRAMLEGLADELMVEISLSEE